MSDGPALMFAALVALLALGMGTLVLLRPQVAARAYGVPPAGGFDVYLAAAGARNLAIGAALLVLALSAERHAAGIVVMATAICGLVDGYATRRCGHPRFMAFHLAGTVLLVVLGAAIAFG